MPTLGVITHGKFIATQRPPSHWLLLGSRNNVKGLPHRYCHREWRGKNQLLLHALQLPQQIWVLQLPLVMLFSFSLWRPARKWSGPLGRKKEISLWLSWHKRLLPTEGLIPPSVQPTDQKMNNLLTSAEVSIFGNAEVSRSVGRIDFRELPS